MLPRATCPLHARGEKAGDSPRFCAPSVPKRSQPQDRPPRRNRTGAQRHPSRVDRRAGLHGRADHRHRSRECRRGKAGAETEARLVHPHVDASRRQLELCRPERRRGSQQWGDTVTPDEHNPPVRRFLASVSLVALSLLVSSATGIGGVSQPPPRSEGLIVFSWQGGLSTIQPNGRGLRGLPGTEGDSEPAWSPDGRMLAVTRADGIWLRAADGSHARRLTRRHPQGYDGQPAWSPDGKQIVFDRGTPKSASGGLQRGLWIVGANGGRPRPLLLSPGGQGEPEWSIGNPDWSPDGRRIAFGFGLEREGLMTIRTDGTGLRRLGPPTLRGRDPHWSPDGRQIAFLEFSEGGRHRFRILDLLSSRVRTVFTSEGSTWVQSWSPNGHWLAIMATQLDECEFVELSDECESLALWKVNTTNARRTLINSFGQQGADVSGIDWRASRRG